MNETVFNSVYFPICNLQILILTPDETFSYAKRELPTISLAGSSLPPFLNLFDSVTYSLSTLQ